MRLSNGFVIDKEKTFGELKFTAVRDVFLQNGVFHRCACGKPGREVQSELSLENATGQENHARRDQHVFIVQD